MHTDTKAERLLKYQEVVHLTGYCRANIYNFQKIHSEAPDARRRFPAPVKIGRTSRWRMSDVQAWIARQAESTVTDKT